MLTTICRCVWSIGSSPDLLLSIQGKAKAIGVSNFCNHAMEAVLATATIKPAVNQVLYHAGMGPDPDGIVSL